jgi:hypothetical protein
MEDESKAEEELERLQSLHDTVERLRAQLKTIQMEEPSSPSEPHPPDARNEAKGGGPSSAAPG